MEKYALEQSDITEENISGTISGEMRTNAILSVIIAGIFPAREKQADFPDISPSTIVDAAAGLKDASAGTWIQPVEDMCLAAKMMAMRAHHGDVIFTVGAGDITDMDQVLLTALEAHRESCE